MAPVHSKPEVNQLQKQTAWTKIKAKRTTSHGDPERKQENSYVMTKGREHNKQQVILQLEVLGINHPSS